MGKNKTKTNKKNVGKANKKGKQSKTRKILAKPKVVKVDLEITSEESELEQPIVKPTHAINQVDEVDSDDSLVPNSMEDVAGSDSEHQDAEDRQSVDTEDNDGSDSSNLQSLPKNPTLSKCPPTKAKTIHHSDSENPPCVRVFIANLSRSSNDESIASFFERNSLPTTDVYLPKNNGVHKGFAFAELKDVQSATRAVGLSGEELDGTTITISFAKPKRGEQGTGNGSGESGDSNILFVKNLGPKTTREILQGHFKNASEIRLMTDDDGNCRGHAYVEYSSSAEAKSAKEKMVGHQIEGSQIFVDFAKPRGFNTRGGSSFRGRGNSFGERGRGFNRDSRGGRGGRGDRGGFHRGGRDFSRGRGGFQNRGGGHRPRGNRMQFNDD